jgi:L-fuculokinase
LGTIIIASGGIDVKTKTVAVLDVGKTNKKVRLYNRALEVVAEERTTVEPYLVDGLEVEDSGRLLAWFQEALKKLSADYEIRAITITTHGATCAFLGADGKLSHPVISYTAEKGAEVQEEFYATYGPRAELHRATCSPDLGFANIGKILHYAKTRLPEVWANTRHALFYTNYLGYELTGAMGADPTYIGNHTYLWDFRAKTWSAVGKALGADALFPSKVLQSWEQLGVVKPEIAQACGLPADCGVTLGIHDSNANFLPYLAQGYENFLLNSSGTWCVLMRQAHTPDLTDDEIAGKVFFNLNPVNEPVRTCVFPAGMEYETFRGFTDNKDTDDLDAALKVIADKRLFVVPGVLPDATAFPGATPRVVDGDTVHTLDQLKASAGRPLTGLGQAYYSALNLSLAFATRRMLNLCGVNEGTTVFIEGGFANNKLYCELLAALCPKQTIALTSVKEGTSFGAALTAWMLAEGLSLEDIGKEFTIGTREVARRDFPGIAEYERAFTALLSN